MIKLFSAGLFSAALVLSAIPTHAAEDPAGQVEQATSAAEDAGYTVKSLVLTGDKYWQIDAGVSQKVTFIRMQEQEKLGFHYVVTRNAQDEIAAYSELREAEYKVIGPNSGFEWAKLEGDNSFTAMFATSFIAQSEAPSIVAKYADQATETEENQDGTTSYVVVVNDVALTKEGRLTNEPEVVEQVESTSIFVEANADDVVIGASIQSAYEDGSKVRKDSVYTYGPVNVKAPASSVTMPAASYDKVAATVVNKALVGKVVNKVRKASQGKTFTHPQLVKLVKNKLAATMQSTMGSATVADGKTKVSIVSQDVWNNKPLTAVFAVKSGKVVRVS